MRTCTLVICVLFTPLAGPSHALGAEDADALAYFEQHIRPVLIARCYSCHSERDDAREGGLLLDRRAGWVEGGERGPAIVAGDPDASLLIQAMKYADSDLQMPPDKPLSADVVRKFEHWVRIGAPDPRDGQAVPAGDDPSDPIAGRSHWAFQPLATGMPPEVADPNWSRGSIDRYVLARLEATQLSPAPEADRTTLARRIYIHLTGLPPTAGQVEEFLSDDRADAYERLVDQLLASPQFGERWGRHWLDLARYADSNGLDENFLFREAWRYRNWVLRAVNSDLPYDRFLLEQLAGDMLPYDSVAERDRQRIAAGFLVLGPKVLLGNDPRKQRMEVADEQLDTIGRAVLGQTLGCARCHDHKFDPIPTADYYALAGIFTSTEVMEGRYMLGQQRVMERLVGLGAVGEQADDAYESYWRDRPQLQERQNRAKAALEHLQKDEEEAFQKLSNEHADATAEPARDASLDKAIRLEAQQKLVDEVTVRLDNPPAIPPRAMVPTDRAEPADEFIRLAGQFDRQGTQVPRGVLQVVGDQRPQISPGQSGRVELGRWLTDVEHGAGRLAARVLANRIWHHLIGRGLVRTVDNFGRTGEPPSHPELLDYLAVRLIESNWSVKSLIREIALSRTFTMSSRDDDAGYGVDPENALLWRAHRRRLAPEVLRDSMLQAAGELDLAPMDSSVWYLGDQATAVGDNKNRRRTDFPCRSVYLPVIRNDLPELFDVFDFANPHATTGSRPRTMVATQGLYLLNDDSVMAAAEATARRVLAEEPSADEARVNRMFERILSASATPDERDQLLSFIAQMRQRLKEENDAEAELHAWTMACQALFASSRFQILE